MPQSTIRYCSNKATDYTITQEKRKFRALGVLKIKRPGYLAFAWTYTEFESNVTRIYLGITGMTDWLIYKALCRLYQASTGEQG